jgi:hypothetical protein
MLVIEHGEPEQAKALLAILPTYRVSAPVVCAPNSSVEPTRLNANRFARLAGGRMSLKAADDALRSQAME